MSEKKSKKWFVFAGVLAAVILIVFWIEPWKPAFPVALIRVADAAGHPVSGATITPEGMRTKPGPYVSGWYGWAKDRGHPPNPPVITDGNGEARIAYPNYVFEKIETGTLCLAVSHPDYVSDRLERVVNSLPTAGTPLREWIDVAINRFKAGNLEMQTEPIKLRKGAILKISVQRDSEPSLKTPLYGQVSRSSEPGSNFWIQAGPEMLVTRRLAEGTQTVRVVQFDAKGAAWFSDVKEVVGKLGETTELNVGLVRGATLRGQLDADVPRPVRKGRVIAHVWPEGFRPDTYPPQWHAWSSVREDGRFEITSLPAGILEVVVLCEGYISTNGAGRSGLHYPQKHTMGTNDLEITVGMEQTAILQALVTDNMGKPVAGANVMTAPNVRYGEWSATIVGSDLYNMADSLRGTLDRVDWRKRTEDFWELTDSNGVAIIANLPVETRAFHVDHPTLGIPAADRGSGQKDRSAPIQLKAGVTNYASVRLEPLENAPIAHR